MPVSYTHLWDEVFRERGSSDIATLTVRGGASKLRYYTMLNLQNGRGFYKNANENDGYSCLLYTSNSLVF